MSIGSSGQGACPVVRVGRGHVQWGRRQGSAGLLAGCASTPAWGRRGDLLCRHYKGQRDLDVGLSGADGARTVADGEQVAEGIDEAVVQAVSDNYPCSGYGIEQEILGPGQIHQFIV